MIYSWNLFEYYSLWNINLLIKDVVFLDWLHC